MKKTIVLSLILFSLAGGFSVVNAQGNSVTGQHQAVHTQTNATEPQGVTNQTRNRALQEIANRIHTRFDAHIQLYNQFVLKLETRRGKLVEAGADTAELDKQIRLAKTEIATTKNSIATFKSYIATIDYSQDISTVRNEFRAQITQIRQQFQLVHRLMVQAVTIIAQLSK